VRNLHEKQRSFLEVKPSHPHDRGHLLTLRVMQDLCLKACIGLQCAKVSILLLEKERCWLIQLVYSLLHGGVSLSNQADGLNVYEGFKNNLIAQSAISTSECIVVSNVQSHAGYDSALDIQAGVAGRNCLAAPIMTAETKSDARCVGVLFATNRTHDTFLGIFSH
jgi:hypothetical protein